MLLLQTDFREALCLVRMEHSNSCNFKFLLWRRETIIKVFPSVQYFATIIKFRPNSLH